MKYLIYITIFLALAYGLVVWTGAKDDYRTALADCIASQAEADGIAFHPHGPEAWAYYEEWCIEQMNK